MAEAKRKRRYRHLSYEGRVIIGQKRKEGSRFAEIGRLLGRASSTISREIRRNEQFAGTRYWYAIHAQMKANGRRRRSYRKERLSEQAGAGACRRAPAPGMEPATDCGANEATRMG